MSNNKFHLSFCSFPFESDRFDLLFRRNPFGGEYTVFAGLEECVRFASNFRFTERDIAYLRKIMPASCEVRMVGVFLNCAWTTRKFL